MRISDWSAVLWTHALALVSGTVGTMAQAAAESAAMNFAQWAAGFGAIAGGILALVRVAERLGWKQPPKGDSS